MVGINIFVISLISSNRRSFQENQFERLGLNFDFLDAISSESITEPNYLELSNDWQRPMKKSEVACYLSHQLAWKKVLESQTPALILEDDALISSDISLFLEDVKKVDFCDLINLENRGRKKFVSKKPIISIANHSLLKLYLDNTGAAGYILWPSGARKLFDCEANKGFALADAQIHNCKHLKSFQVEPSPIIQLDMIKHYKIEKKFDKELSKSSVSSRERINAGLLYKFRRIWSQLKLGLYQIKFIFFGTRRFINILPEKFSGPS